MSNLSILNSEIRQFNNFYSLNDLHKISGNKAKHRPNQFLRIDQTQELIEEINQCADLRTENKCLAHKTINGGINRGTYVCKELVYAYAMWISPTFYLHVIRSFDALATKPAKRIPFKLPEPVEKHPLTDFPLKDATLANCRCVIEYNNKGELNPKILPLPLSYKHIDSKRLADDMTQALQALERIDTYAKLNLFAPVFKS